MSVLRDPAPLNEAFCAAPQQVRDDGASDRAEAGLDFVLAQDWASENLGGVEGRLYASPVAPVAACSAFPSLLPKISQVQLVDEIISAMFSLLRRTSLGCCCGFQQCRTPPGHVWSLFLVKDNLNVSGDLAEISDVLVA